MEFKIGDIVIVNDKTSYNNVIGKVGSIVDLNSCGGHIGILIKGFNGHNLDGKIESDEGYWIEWYALEYYKNNNRSMY